MDLELLHEKLGEINFIRQQMVDIVYASDLSPQEKFYFREVQLNMLKLTNEVWDMREPDLDIEKLEYLKECILNDVEQEMHIEYEVVSQLINMPYRKFVEVIDKFGRREGALITLQETILKMWTEGIDISAFDNNKSMTLIGMINMQSH